MIEKQELIDILREHNFTEKTISRILNKRIKTLLKRGKAGEIKGILEVLDEYGINKETIENCLSVLAMGKAKEIQDILQVLKEHGINKETIENCLSVLARGKAREIQDILVILEEHGIDKNSINRNYAYIFNTMKKHIKNIFSEGNEFIGEYMRLCGLSNRIISVEEIEYVCESKKVTIEEVISSIRRRRVCTTI